MKLLSLCLAGTALLLSACSTTTPDIIDPRTFRAQGNEPGWHIDLQNGHASIVLNYGDTRYTSSAAQTLMGSTQTRYSGQGPNGDWTLTVIKQECSDTMSDQSYEYTSILKTEGKTLRGCGNYLPQP